MSCRGKSADSEVNLQELITQQSEDLTILSSKNGVLSYRFWTPLLERYELAREPYMEFRKGIKIETYNDSTRQVESTLTANYAIFLENQELWEAKGNVVGTNAKGQKLETQQLFWNQKTKRIYSNVDSKVTQGSDVIIGVGFESDETFSDFTFRRPQGRVEVDVEPRDSTKNGSASSAGSTAPVQGRGTQQGGPAAPQPSGQGSDAAGRSQGSLPAISGSGNAAQGPAGAGNEQRTPPRPQTGGHTPRTPADKVNK